MNSQSDLFGLALFGLLVVWAALLFGGYLLGRAAEPGERRMPRWTRIGSSFVLVVAAWVFVPLAQGAALGCFPLLIATGMTLGFLGDLFLARLIPFPNHTLGGMAAFALGHVAYIAAGVGAAQTRLDGLPPLNALAPRLAGWLAWLLVGFLGWYFIVFRGQKKHDVLDWAALPYSLLLASTAGVFTGLALQSAAFIPSALGAALFLFSDLMIAAKLFAGRQTRGINIDDLIWLTYGPGQMLIVYTPLWLLLSA